MGTTGRVCSREGPGEDAIYARRLQSLNGKQQGGGRKAPSDINLLGSGEHVHGFKGSIHTGGGATDCSEGQASLHTATASQASTSSRAPKQTPNWATKLLQRMRVVKPWSVSSQTSDFDQACLPGSTPTSGINSPKGSPPETLFDFYGVSRESEWGKIISDCYKGISGETPLQARERAGPLNLNIQGPGGKWPLTHAERICELQSFLEDPTQTRYHNDILAAIDFHRGFNQNDICSHRPTYFQNSRRVGANERNGLCWREGPISMKCNKITGSPVQNSTTSMPPVRTNHPHLPTTHHAAYAWDEEIEMYKVINPETS